MALPSYVVYGMEGDCIDHMRRTHKVPLSVKAANLAKYFPAWTVTRDQWSKMLMPCISGVAIDTLLLSRVGSPLCHRYRLISHTGIHAAFRGMYLKRLRMFIEELDSAVGRRLHRRLAQDLAARVVKSTDNPASGHPRSPVGHRIVSRPQRPRRLTSSLNEESLDVKKCEDFAVTIMCHSEEADTRVNSEEVLSDEDFPVVFGAKDIRQVVRQRDRPPGSPTRRTARSDSRQEPSAPAVDLVTGKCKPGKVSRTVSTSPLTLDMTVMCTPEADILQPGAAAQGVLPQDTMTNTVAGFDTCKPAVATPAPVVGQPEPQAKDFPTLRLSESSDLLRRSDCRPRLPRLPHPRCRGAQQRTRRLLFHPTGCVRGTLRMFRARLVCLMCHHFHQDSSYGLLGRAEQPRLKGFCCQRC